jgi:hypothetical protein
VEEKLGGRSERTFPRASLILVCIARYDSAQKSTQKVNSSYYAFLFSPETNLDRRSHHPGQDIEARKPLPTRPVRRLGHGYALMVCLVGIVREMSGKPRKRLTVGLHFDGAAASLSA